MTKVKISISIDKKLLEKLDRHIKLLKESFESDSRSRYVVSALKDKMQQEGILDSVDLFV
jgi:metal-responsive CopG/Arc/MetJ family transcriptional regulator